MNNTKIEIYRETEDGVQYLNGQGRWVEASKNAKLFGSFKSARGFASEHGEDQSASYVRVKNP